MSQINKTLSLSPVKKYEITDFRSGGMGKVYFLRHQKDQSLETFGPTETIFQCSELLQDKFKYIYRDLLAAKTIKDEQYAELFLRELNIWIQFDEQGSVPLLKVHKENGFLFAIMPKYDFSLREVIGDSKFAFRDTIRSTIICVEGLKNILTKHSVIHLDIKPENILVRHSGNVLETKLSDWGIANISGLQTINRSSELEFVETINGIGTLPYMAPERFISHYKPDFKADIFSLGIIYFEMIFGSWPYSPDQSIAAQIVSGKYYSKVMDKAKKIGDKRIFELITCSTNPDKNKRFSEYGKILKLLNKV